jgi:excisionase family DNA binding protein
MEHLMTSDQVADYLGVDAVTIRRLVNRGELSAYRIGSEYRFAPSDIEKYLQRQHISNREERSADKTDEFMLRAGKMFAIDRFGKFTKQAHTVLALSQEEAQRLKNNSIGTEHLLLGLIREGEGVAFRVLANLNIDLNKVRSIVESIIVDYESSPVKEVILTPRTKKVLELAANEAQSLGHSHVGTGHLLLGLIQEGGGIAVDALRRMGVDLEEARMQTIQVLDTPRTPYSSVSSGVLQSLLEEDEQAVTCSHCTTRCPNYFYYCFNCGYQLAHK